MFNPNQDSSGCFRCAADAEATSKTKPSAVLSQLLNSGIWAFRHRRAAGQPSVVLNYDATGYFGSFVKNISETEVTSKAMLCAAPPLY